MHREIIGKLHIRTVPSVRIVLVCFHANLIYQLFACEINFSLEEREKFSAPNVSCFCSFLAPSLTCFSLENIVSVRLSSSKVNSNFGS